MVLTTQPLVLNKRMKNDSQGNLTEGRAIQVASETSGGSPQCSEGVGGATRKARRRKDIEVGQRFGRLVVVSVLTRKYGMGRSDCICDCGVRKIICDQHLVSEKTRSCGCFGRDQAALKNSKYGLMRVSDIRSMRTSVEYVTWSSMMERCGTKTHHAYHHYGGRGINVCEKWRKFSNFFTDMGRRPNGMSLDRIDNNKGYSPENCRWSTMSEQCNNRRTNVVITVGGISKTLSQWSDQIGISGQSLSARIKKGIPLELAVSVKPRPAAILTLNGVSKTIKAWSAELGIKLATIYGRLHAGKSITEALSP